MEASDLEGSAAVTGSEALRAAGSCACAAGAGAGAVLAGEASLAGACSGWLPTKAAGAPVCWLFR
eukprot:764850-Hanusia_phi.AAC.13